MDIDHVVYQAEANAVRLERTIARLWILLIITLILLVGTNIAWLCYESQFEDTITTIESEQEANDGGTNYVVNGDYGKTESKDNN